MSKTAGPRCDGNRCAGGLLRQDPQALAACRSSPGWRIFAPMGTKSRESIFGPSIRASAERAAAAAREADSLRSLEQAHARLSRPGAAVADARRHSQCWLPLSRSGVPWFRHAPYRCAHIRPKTTPIHEPERYMRCKDCSQIRGYPQKRSHLVALRATKISATDPPATWWPGER